MPAKSRLSYRLGILSVFLSNGNRRLHVTGICREIEKMNLWRFEKRGIERVTISTARISKICREMENDHLLEHMDDRPPRHRLETPHYRLPVSDESKAIDASRFLLEKGLGEELIKSEYGKYLIQEIVMAWLETYLGVKMSEEEAKAIRNACSQSPDALKRMLDPKLGLVVKALFHNQSSDGSIPEFLVEYSNSAMVLDRVDSLVFTNRIREV